MAHPSATSAARRSSNISIIEIMDERTTCVIVGGGPGGVMLAYLLARVGVAVTLLESRPGLRPAVPRRHPRPAGVGACSTLLGLADPLLPRRFRTCTADAFMWSTPDPAYRLADYRRTRARSTRTTRWVPQGRFLPFMVGRRPARFPGFRVRDGRAGVLRCCATTAAGWTGVELRPARASGAGPTGRAGRRGRTGATRRSRTLSSITATELSRPRHLLVRGAAPRRLPAALRPRADRRPRDHWLAVLGSGLRLAAPATRSRPAAFPALRVCRYRPGDVGVPPSAALARRPARRADRGQPALAASRADHPHGPVERARAAADRRRRPRDLAGGGQRGQLRRARRGGSGEPPRRGLCRLDPVRPPVRRRGDCGGRGRPAPAGGPRPGCARSGPNAPRPSGWRSGDPRPPVVLSLLLMGPFPRFARLVAPPAASVPSPPRRSTPGSWPFPRHDRRPGDTRCCRHTSCPPTGVRPGGGDHRPPVRLDRRLPGVVHRVDRELVHAQPAQLRQPLQLRRRRAEQAEPVDDLVGHEVRGRGCRPCRGGCSRSPRGP